MCAIADNRGTISAPRLVAMSTSGVGRRSGREGSGSRGDPHPNVADLMKKLQLTAEEEAVVDFSDEEDDMEESLEVALVGKVLSPTPIHVSTIQSAMKPAWGNPVGLRLRAIGEKGDNMFMAEFGTKQDADRILDGTPWMVGKYAVLLQAFDARLRASDIRFDKMEIWARITDLPIGWMNENKGKPVMSKLGKVISLDVDADGKASGGFLRGRVSIDLGKPIMRGVLLRVRRTEEPKWFQAQYERLPYYCYACGIIGHSERECELPAARDEHGRLPYDLQLRAPEERRRRMSFAEAASSSMGGTFSYGPRSTRGSMNRDGARPNKPQETTTLCSEEPIDVGREEGEQEVNSPLKHGDNSRGEELHTETARQLFQVGPSVEKHPRKRKTKSAGASRLDLNKPVSNALIPVGLVNSRMSQFATDADEAAKKQKVSEANKNARSAAAAGCSPRRAQ